MKDYKKINKQAWNLKTEVHLHSEFYDNPAFLEGKTSLNSVELEWLGDVQGESVLHLQCHFGQDSLSLSRMGAQVTGVDLSDYAIGQARKMTETLNLNTRFICADVYDLPAVLEGQFDRVFTSYGVLGWLPDMERWAQVVAHFLKPGGRLLLVEFHPVVWMFDDEFMHLKYSYFNTGEIVETLQGTYADAGAAVSYQTITWNHSLSEVIGALIRAGIRISRFQEFNESPYNCFDPTVRTDKGGYRIRHLDDKIPMLYALEGIRE